MARSNYKFSYFCRTTIKNMYNLYSEPKMLIDLKMHRAATLPRCYVFRSVKIHGGSRYKKYIVNNLKLGFKSGEFVFTRKPYFYPLKKKKK